MTWILTFGLLGTTFLLARFLPQESFFPNGVVVPSSSPDGSVIPVIFGSVRLKKAHVLWYGDVLRKPVHLAHTSLASAVEHILSFLSLSAPRTPVAYDTYASVHLALCRGSHVRLRAVRTLGGIVLWDGNVDNATIAINKPYVLGGSGQGGGIKGIASFTGGQQTTAHPYLVEKGLPAVSYHDIASIIFEKTYWGESNVLPSLSFDCEFFPNTLGVSGGMERIGDDANPACVLYFLLTKDSKALPPEKIDKEEFKEVAKTLYHEGNGCSLLLENTQRYGDHLDDLTRQIDGILLTDHQRGVVTLRLNREHAQDVSLKTWTPENVVEIRNVSRSSALQTFNQVRVAFWDRESDWQKKDLLVQDLAHMRLTQSLREVVVTLPGIHNGEQALRWAYRALRELSSFMLKCRLTVGYKGEGLLPGDCIRLSWPSYGLENILLRIHAIERGTPLDGRWILDCLQEQEHQPIPQKQALPTRTQQPSPQDVQEPFLWHTIEAPYWIGKTLAPRAQSSHEPSLLFLLSPPQQEGTLAFEGLLDGESVLKRNHLWTHHALLHTDIPLDPTVSERWIVNDGWNFDTLLDTSSPQWFLVDEEILAVEHVSRSGSDFLLEKVWRGLLDTLPASHTNGSALWHLNGIFDGGSIAVGEHDVAIKTHGYSRSLTTESRSINIVERHLAPYPVADFSVVQSSDEDDVGAGANRILDVSWKVRNRLEEPVYRDAPSQSPEEGTQYRLSWELVSSSTSSTKEEQILPSESTQWAFPVLSSGDWKVAIVVLRDGKESIRVERTISVV